MKSRGRGHSKRQLDELAQLKVLRVFETENFGAFRDVQENERHLFATFSPCGRLVKGLCSAGGLTMFLSRKDRNRLARALNGNTPVEFFSTLLLTTRIALTASSSWILFTT